MRNAIFIWWSPSLAHIGLQRLLWSHNEGASQCYSCWKQLCSTAANIHARFHLTASSKLWWSNLRPWKSRLVCIAISKTILPCRSFSFDLLDVSASYAINLEYGDLHHICSLAQLQSLSLANRRFSASAASLLSRLTCLSVLSLVGCGELDYCLQHLSALPLTYLYISKSCKSSVAACLKTKMAICRASLSETPKPSTPLNLA